MDGFFRKWLGGGESEAKQPDAPTAKPVADSGPKMPRPPKQETVLATDGKNLAEKIARGEYAARNEGGRTVFYVPREIWEAVGGLDPIREVFRQEFKGSDPAWSDREFFAIELPRSESPEETAKKLMHAINALLERKA